MVNNQRNKMSKEGKPVATQGKETLLWTGKHQETFDLLKSYLKMHLCWAAQISVDHLNFKLMHLCKDWVLYFHIGTKIVKFTL